MGYEKGLTCKRHLAGENEHTDTGPHCGAINACGAPQTTTTNFNILGLTRPSLADLK